MAFFSGWFSKKNQEEDYETILSNLALDIQKRQTKLADIRLRERRSSLLVTLYTLAAYAAYVGLWYANWLPGEHDRQGLDKAVAAFPVVIGPIFVLFIRRIVQFWYKRKGDAEEKTLRALLLKQRNKVEEIKKKTNYYTTRNLIERYDEQAPSTPTKSTRPVNAPMPQAQPQPQKRPIQPQQIVNSPQGSSISSAPIMKPQQAARVPQHLMTSQQAYPSTPQPKQWYDKLADALLGDDEQGANPAATRYALICDKCFTHNGLVKESMWEDAQFACMKCQHMNLSAKAKRQRSQQQSPASTNSSPDRSIIQQSPSVSVSSPNGTTNEILRKRREVVGQRDDGDSSMMEVDS